MPIAGKHVVRSAFRCAACRMEWNRDKVYRVCGFHPGTQTFHHRNRKCATLSRLRWLLRQNGVAVYHPELEGPFANFTMGVLDGAGESAGRLQGMWFRGSDRTMLMQIVKGDEVLPLHYATAERLLREFKLDQFDDVRKLSADFTR